MSTENADMVSLVIRDGDECWVEDSLEADTALTVIGVVSEDPESREEMAVYWPRYRTPPVGASLESLSLKTVPEEAARDAIEATDAWAFIDLPRKRVLTGPAYQEVGRKAAFAMSVDEDGRQRYPMMVNLAPWWELHEQVNAGMIDHPRQSPVDRPVVNRDVLFGDPLLEYIAERCLDIVRSERWSQRDMDEQQPNYPFTVEVHRDWLMTPRDELDGAIPRDMLHGGIDWIDGLVHGQRLRCDAGGRIVAAPEDVDGFECDPMGREEVVVYFDLCRELISASWDWCGQEETRGRIEKGQDCTGDLVDFLTYCRDEFMDTPHGSMGSATAGFIIECSRRRVPRGAGVPIIGMTESQPEMEMFDDDCPICQMMGEGGLGVAFTGLDGHHLELDEEFAFSLCETREEWEERQREFEEMSAEFDRKRKGREAAAEDESEDLGPTWSGQVSDEPIPGDTDGHLGLAFMLAEIIAILESRDAPREDIHAINERFAEFRNCDPDELAKTGRRLADQLESLTNAYPDITSRVADFCSRIDERMCSARMEDGDDVPF